MTNNNNFKNNHNSIVKYGKNLSIIFIAIAIVMIISLFFNMLLSETELLRFGLLGNAVGGLLQPPIGLAAALLTFLAFYVQYLANIDVKNQFKTQQFESQFYEMLRLHKDNVNEITLYLTSDSEYRKELLIHNETINGRETFKYFLEEFKIIYFVFKKNYPSSSPNDLINKAYEVFYHGIPSHSVSHLNTTQNTPFDYVVKNLHTINNGNRTIGFRGNQYRFRELVSEASEYNSAKVLNYDLFKEHSFQIGHYYRHLYQTVKYITKQPEKFLTYSMKRHYLRILRSQLSNQEQAMLFYNWKSKFGKNWENDSNKFLTDFRMIHNLNNDILIEDFDLAVIFDIENQYYKMEKGRNDDYLFEFQSF